MISKAIIKFLSRISDSNSSAVLLESWKIDQNEIYIDNDKKF